VTKKSAFSFVRQLSTWHCPHLLLSAALQARRAAIDRYISCPPGAKQQTRSCGERMMGRTMDGEIDR